MALIKCSECGEKISSNAERCIHCNHLLSKEVKTKGIITDFETEQTIISLNRLSKILSIILVLGGIVFIFVSIGFEEPILIALSITSIIVGFIIPTFIKWKAMMLKNIYEINRKVGN